jgi:acetyl-CoA carboxylase carboxyl transferase subunit beta
MARGGWFGHRNKKVANKASVPDGLWIKCPGCSEILFARDVERNLKVCPKCSYHHRLNARERLSQLLDEGSFEELDPGLTSRDPLCFPEYAEKIARARAGTGLVDAILTGTGRIGGHTVVIGTTDFGFMGGSMGSVVGERIARAVEHAVRERLPVLLVTANGGGARMQEGLLSLMQMAKTGAAVARLAEEGLPYIVLLTDPTMAGVLASFASLGDVTLAEPHALVGFAGRRVGNQDVGVKLPDDFQTSEFQARFGMIDQIVPRQELRAALTRLLAFFAEASTPEASIPEAFVPEASVPEVPVDVEQSA